jgi:hypothetical protein
LREFAEAPPERTRSHGFNTDADAITRSLHEDLGIELAVMPHSLDQLARFRQ